MRGFLGAKRYEPLDLGDPTVDIIVTLDLPRPLELINSGPNSAKTPCYLPTIYSKIRVLFHPPAVSRYSAFCKVSDVFFVSAHFFFFFFCSPLSSPRASFFFVFVLILVFVLLFLYNRLLVGRCGDVPHHVKVVRGDDPKCCRPVELPQASQL